MVDDLPRVHLVRVSSSDQGTFGRLSAPHAGFRCHVIELPWRDNQPNVSCIPAGEYFCAVTRSPRFGRVYHVHDVPGRSHVLIHSGNYAGAEDKGFRTHSHGCILPGMHEGNLGGQRAVLSSKTALTKLHSAMEWQPFTLVVQGGADA